MRTTIKPFISVLLCALAFTLTAVAQESRGTIIGRVADASDAVVPGAKVEIKNTATNVTTSATTNEVKVRPNRVGVERMPETMLCA